MQSKQYIFPEFQSDDVKWKFRKSFWEKNLLHFVGNGLNNDNT